METDDDTNRNAGDRSHRADPVVRRAPAQSTGLNSTVPQGIVYGMLGPNGAGKTTTIRMLATLLRPDAGPHAYSDTTSCANADAVRRHVSLTGQFASVDSELTGLENLDPARPAARPLTSGREGSGRRAARDLRSGRRRRTTGDEAVRRHAPAAGHRREPDRQAEACCSSTSRPPGLDPRSRQQTWEIVRGDRRAGHDRRAHDPVPRRGRPAVRPDRCDRPWQSDRRGNKRRAQGLSRRRHAPGPAARPRPAQRGAAAPRARRSTHPSASHPTRPSSPPRSRPATAHDELGARATRALAELAAAGIAVNQFALAQPTLDEAFLALTGRPAEPRRPTPGGGTMSSTETLRLSTAHRSPAPSRHPTGPRARCRHR